MARILYRLRLGSEQRPFDLATLSYILPLIFIVLDRDGIEESKDSKGEQILLALEFLSFHTNSCKFRRHLLVQDKMAYNLNSLRQ